MQQIEEYDGPSNAAAIGFEIGSMIRTHAATGTVSTEEIWSAFAAMLAGEADSVADVLAVLVTARPIIANHRVEMEAIDGDPYPTDCALALLDKAIEALERLSGINAGTFNGSAPLAH